MSYKKEMLNDLAKDILAAGFRVFIAGSGEYGFYTDTAGSRVISISTDFGSVKFSGNYETDAPYHTGTGWVIGENRDDYDVMFNLYAPSWAVGSATKVKMTTLDQHLKTYQWSSKYKEVKNAS